MSDIEARFCSQKQGFSLDINTVLPGKGITGVFGTSGSGKTTFLRCLAGLERVEKGYLRVQGDIWQDDTRFLPTHKRKLGYVFQEASLFGHLSIQQNLEYGWKRTPKAQRRTTFSDVIELLGLEPFLTRYAAQLSGGQRQRVAIARALLTSPTLLLMDEPLSNLDIKSKQDILPYLERLHDDTQIPIMYVSHSPDEIVRLADHLICLEQGKIIASGEINELLTRSDLPLANLDEACAIVNCTVKSHEPDFHVTHLRLACTSNDSPSQLNNIMIPEKPLAVNSPVRVRILARDVSIALHHAEHTSISNILPATVMEVFPCDNPFQVMVKLNMQGQVILSKITQRSHDVLNLKPGLSVFAQVKSVALVK